MARPRRNDNPVNLFPFLAVLMCTMGALIFLLIVISKSIKEDAIAESKRPPEQSESEPITEPEPLTMQVALLMAELDRSPPLPEPLPKTLPEPNSFVATVSPFEEPVTPSGPTFEEIQLQLADLSEVQNDLEKQLNEKQEQIKLLEAEIARATKETQLAKAKSNDVEGQFQASLARVRSKELELAEAQTDRKRLVRLINESNELVAMKENENAQASSEFVIVPYDGETGTTRRPIILDCTDEAIRLVGEDIELTPGQLVGYTPVINPLKSSVEELVRFWATRDRVSNGANVVKQAKVPYVLLIVRPSGTVAFYVARKYLQDLGADFGYELVEEDFKFASEKSPDEAVELCRAAILQTLRLRRTTSGKQVASFLQSLEADNQRLRAARNARGNRSGTGGESGAGGSFDALTDSGKSMDSWDSRDVARRGARASQGFFGSSDFRNRGNAATGSNRPLTGNVRRPFQGGPSQGGRGPSDRSDSTRNGVPRVGASNGTGGGKLRSGEVVRGDGTSAQGTPNSRQDLGQGRNPLLPGRSKQNGNIPELRTQGNGNERNGSTAIAQPNRVDGGNTAGDGRNTANGADDREINGPNTGSGSSSNQANSSPAQQTPNAVAGQETKRSPFENANNLDAARQIVRGNQRAGSPSQLLAGGARDGSAGSTNARSEGGQSNGESQNAQATTRAGQRPNSNGATGQSAMGAPNPSRPPSRSAVQPTLQLKPSRNRMAHFKRQWGIKNPNGSIAIEKTMIVRVNAQKVVIGDKLQIRITDERLPEQIVEWTVEAVDRVAREWGPPPTRFYWSPAVKLVVDPGGELMLERMSRTLRQYGVSVEINRVN